MARGGVRERCLEAGALVPPVKFGDPVPECFGRTEQALRKRSDRSPGGHTGRPRQPVDGDCGVVRPN